MAKKSEWAKVRDVVHGARAFKITGQEGRSDDQLPSRLARALKNFGLNDTAGFEAENGARDYHVILAGPPRGGKATLIEAVCGRKLNAENMRLASRDKEVGCYVKTNQHRGLPHTVTFWSTIGADQWTKDSIRSYIHDITKMHDPIFLLFCVSPINVVPDDKLGWLIESCIEENVFCALAMTNIHVRGRCNTTIRTITKVLERCSAGNGRLTQAAIDPAKSYTSGITLYNHTATNRPVALICSVNSIKYVETQPPIQNDPSGVFEMILTIMDSLPDDKMAEMIYMVLNNRPFWDYVAQTFSQSWNDLFLKNFRRWYESQS